MESKDPEVPAWAVALWRVQKQRVNQARNAVIEAEKKFALLEKAEEESRIRLEKARAEEKKKKARDE